MAFPSFSGSTVSKETRSLLVFAAVFIAFVLLKAVGGTESLEIDSFPAPTVSSTTTGTTVPVREARVSTTTIAWSETVVPNAVVTRVVDGDTADVLIDGTSSTTRIRLLGINTPESVDPRRPVQCFGKEASMALKELIQGERVALMEDPQADDRDRYGRWLRTIVLEDGTDANATMIIQGYAHAYLDFPLSKARKAQLRALQAQAEAAKTGLWNEATCAGEAYK